MTLSTRALKAFSAVGAVAVCSASGVLVASDPKPATAPLRPPVSGASSSASALVIPPSCGGASVATGGSMTALDPSLVPIVQQLQAAKAGERRAILGSLTPSQRLEVEAYVRGLRRTASGASGVCAGSGGTVAGGSIAPSVVEAPAPAQPLINTYVS